jgi:hypothetical protein
MSTLSYAPYNPWWTRRDWDARDPLIQAFEGSTLKREPRLYYHLRKYITKPGKYGVITIRGPRRVGKTTLIKLLIRYLIREEHVSPRSVFYVSLDYEGLRDVKLSWLLEAIAGSSRLEKYVFLMRLRCIRVGLRLSRTCMIRG